MKQKKYFCDFEGCNEIAQWYRAFKGKLFTFCTKHEAMFSRKHWGRHLRESDLTKDDLEYLVWKDASIDEWMRK